MSRPSDRAVLVLPGGAGQAHARAAHADYLGASEALTRLASGFGWDDQTKSQLGRAADVFQRATAIEGALG